MLIELLYIILGVSIFGIFWTYMGYPLFIFIISKIMKKEHKYDENYQPNVSIIIPCHNEEKVIEKKIKNTLDLNYPMKKTEIIVVDDGSKDNTSKIVENFINIKKAENIILLRQEREGKNVATNSGLKNAKYEIVVISDADSFLDKNALKYCVRHFSDDKIGCVGGRYLQKINIPTGESLGISLYQKIEQFLYMSENKVFCLHETYGWLQAFRKNLLFNRGRTTAASVDSDLTLAVKIRGYLIIMDPCAISWEYAQSSTKDLSKQKIRTIIGYIDVVLKYGDLFNPLKYGLFSISFISHKLMQIMTPFFIIGVFFSSVSITFLTSNNIVYYLVLLELVGFFIGSAVMVISNFKEINIQPFPLIKFFTLMQIICLISWINYFSRNYKTSWETIQNSRSFKNE